MATSAQGVEADRDARTRLAEARRRAWLDRVTSLGALVAIVVIASISIHSFPHPNNIINVLRQSCVNALLAAGQTFVILTGGIDLSVGSYLALVGVTAVALMSPEGGYAWNPWVASIVCVLFSGLLGMFTGCWVIGWGSRRVERRIERLPLPEWLIGALKVLIQKSAIPPFIVTLSMALIMRGLALAITQAQPRLAPEEFGWLGQESMLGIPVPVYIAVIAYGVCFFILTRTKFGRSVYAIGGNEEVARLSGININKVKLLVYGTAGLLAGIAGVVLASRMGAAQVAVGQGDELASIAAVVIGGTSLMGGEGTIWGTLIGTLIIAVVLNILNLLAIPAYGQYLARGAVIMLAVYVDSTLRNRRRS